MKVIRFSTNYNNKLNCKHFTIMRMNKVYEIGEHVGLDWNYCYKIGTIVDRRRITLDKVTDWACYLDLGMNKTQAINQLARVYGIDLIRETTIVYLYLISAHDQWKSLEEEHIPFYD